MRRVQGVGLALFYTLVVGLFAVFMMGGVASLPAFGKGSEELAFTERFDSAEARLREAIAALQRASEATSPERAAEESATSRRLAERSLELRPLNPQAWIVRAQANYLLGDDAAARADWQRSFERGPYEQVIASERADLGIRLWHHLAAEQKARLLAQLRWTWRTAPGETLALARLSANHQLLVRRALADDPAALERFERRLKTGA